MDSVTTNRIVLGVTVFALLGFTYYMYTERRRYKNALMRKKLRKQRENQLMFEVSAVRKLLPDVDDPKDQETFILYEIQMGEELMADGKYDKAVVHFASAIAVCAEPHRLVLALKDSLPPMAFDLLLKVLANDYGKKFNRSRSNSPGHGVVHQKYYSF